MRRGGAGEQQPRAWRVREDGAERREDLRDSLFGRQAPEAAEHDRVGRDAVGGADRGPGAPLPLGRHGHPLAQTDGGHVTFVRKVRHERRAGAFAVHRDEA